MDNKREELIQKSVDTVMEMEEMKRIIDITTIYKLLVEKGIVTDQELSDTKSELIKTFRQVKEIQYREQIEKMSDGEFMVHEMFANLGMKTEK